MLCGDTLPDTKFRYLTTANDPAETRYCLPSRQRVGAMDRRATGRPDLTCTGDDGSSEPFRGEKGPLLPSPGRKRIPTNHRHKLWSQGRRRAHNSVWFPTLDVPQPSKMTQEIYPLRVDASFVAPTFQRLHYYYLAATERKRNTHRLLEAEPLRRPYLPHDDRRRGRWSVTGNGEQHRTGLLYRSRLRTHAAHRIGKTERKCSTSPHGRTRIPLRPGTVRAGLAYGAITIPAAPWKRRRSCADPAASQRDRQPDSRRLTEDGDRA